MKQNNLREGVVYLDKFLLGWVTDHGTDPTVRRRKPMSNEPIPRYEIHGNRDDIFNGDCETWEGVVHYFQSGLPQEVWGKLRMISHATRERYRRKAT